MENWSGSWFSEGVVKAFQSLGVCTGVDGMRDDIAVKSETSSGWSSRHKSKAVLPACRLQRVKKDRLMRSSSRHFSPASTPFTYPTEIIAWVSEPWWSNSSIMEAWPRITASCRAVRPSRFLQLTSPSRSNEEQGRLTAWNERDGKIITGSPLTKKWLHALKRRSTRRPVE